MSKLPIRAGQVKVAQFLAWLADNGAEIGKPTNPYEVVRYRAYHGAARKAVTHIIYTKESGLLTWCGGSMAHYRAFLEGEQITFGVEQPKAEPSPFLVPARARQSARAADEGRQTKGEVRRDKLLARDGDECWFCGLAMGDDCTIEHLVPKSRGGSNRLDNYALAHRACNNRAANLPLVQKIELRAKMRPAPVDTDRMAETALAGSGRSLGSAVGSEAGEAPTTSFGGSPTSEGGS